MPLNLQLRKVGKNNERTQSVLHRREVDKPEWVGVRIDRR